MLPAQRHVQIHEALRSARVVSSEELARLLNVSTETIRRDLMLLERQGTLVRVHGGATGATGFRGQEASFLERADMDRDAKAVIGAAAASLFVPGQTVVLDVGTTAVEVARAIPSSFRGTVATCSLLVAAELAGRPGIDVLVSGGRVRAGDLACSNYQTVAFFADLRPDIAFIGTGGVDVSAGLTDYHLDEVAARRLVVANSERCYALADASKFERVAPHRVCDLNALDGIITNGPLPAALQEALEQRGSVVIAA